MQCLTLYPALSFSLTFSIFLYYPLLPRLSFPSLFLTTHVTAYTHFPALLSTSKVKAPHIFQFNGYQSNLFEYLKTIDSRIVWWNNKSLLLTELSSVARCGRNRNPDRRNVERQNNKKITGFSTIDPNQQKNCWKLRLTNERTVQRNLMQSSRFSFSTNLNCYCLLS